MKQIELAKQLGISKSYLSMILSGQRKASPELAMKISSLFFVNSEAKLSLRGRCPRPLDECATLADHSGLKSNFVAAAVTIIQQKYNGQHRAQIRLRGLIGAIPMWLHS